MYLFISIHSKTENKRNLNGNNFSAILENNSTKPGM
jgi:hypothetical protein